MHCTDSLSLNLNPNYREPHRVYFTHKRGVLAGGDTWGLPGITEDEEHLHSNLKLYLEMVTNYSPRKLSFATDKQNAFAGIIQHFANLSQGPIHQIWGVPFFNTQTGCILRYVVRQQSNQIRVFCSWPIVDAFQKMLFPSTRKTLEDRLSDNTIKSKCFPFY